jgi:feruloyl esterase
VDQTCRVDATVTHPPARDLVKIYVALPLKDWNGRFQDWAVAGSPAADRTLTCAAVQPRIGAAASTNTGHEGGSGSFASTTSGG